MIKRILGDRVLIRPIKSSGVTSTTGIQAQVNREKTFKGEVVNVGPGLFTTNGNLIPVGVAIGDVVSYAKGGDTERQIGGEKFDLIRDSQIEFVYESENTPVDVKGALAETKALTRN